MAIDPKDYGQCWSCKHCRDVGVHTFEEHVTYMRQCGHPGHDIIDKCVERCEHYEWDGTRTEYWRPHHAPSGSASASEKVSESGSFAGKPDISFLLGIAIVIGALVLIGLVVVLLNRSLQPAEAENVPDEISAADSTQDPADYSLAGQLRIVATQSGNGLNIRATPDKNGAVVSAIPDNQAVMVQKTLGNWAYVSFSGFEGWCSMDYLLTEEAHTRLMEEYLNISATVVTESTSLRLRATPSLESAVIEYLPKGCEVIVLRLEGEWAYVDYQGMSGWCARAYLALQE